MPLSPEYQAMFEQLANAEPAPSLWEMTPEQGREMYRAVRPVIDELPIGRIDNQIIEDHGTKIPIRIYYPEAEGPFGTLLYFCLLYTSPSPRDRSLSRMPSSA